MELREIQKSMLDIAVYFDEFCREHDLQYVICGGSLLGAVRHKNFIPWDDDFDVAMPRDDFNKWLQIWTCPKNQYNSHLQYQVGPIYGASHIDRIALP